LSWLPRTIQGLILFSTLLGVAFLYQAYPLLPSDAFEIVTFGWVLFVIDSVLTFVRPKISFYLGLFLAVVALGETVSQPEHYQLVASGNIPATITLVLGSGAEALLIILVAYYIFAERGKDPWAWPGAKSDDGDEKRTQ
jgi:hypothetical protein